MKIEAIQSPNVRSLRMSYTEFLKLSHDRLEQLIRQAGIHTHRPREIVIFEEDPHDLQFTLSEDELGKRSAKTPMKPELDNYDWKEAFGYAGEEGACGQAVIRPALPPDLHTYNLSPFTREDVALVCGLIEGENDGPPWRIYGQLKDGRWFYLEAGCDYTGWDCQAGGSATISDNKEELIRFGLDDRARKLFKLPAL